MKRWIALILVMLLTICMTACVSFEKTETIYVNTKSVRTLAGQVIRTEYTYSPKGTPVTVKTYFNDRLYQTASARTSGGVQYMTIIDNSGNETTQSTNTVYDENGNVATVEITVGSNLVSRTRYTYDDQNRLTAANTVTTLGNTDIQYVYDAQGNLAEQIKDDASQDTYIRTTYSYNEKGLVIFEKSFNREGEPVRSISYAYNETNTVRTASGYDAEGNPTGEVVIATFDEHGNMVREESVANGEVVQTIVNTYEAMEIPVEE